MSLDYSYIFSQIDKAKKKKKKEKKLRGGPTVGNTGRRADGSIPWGSKLDIKNRKRLAEEEKNKPKTGRNRYPGYISDKKFRKQIKEEKDAEKKKIQDKKERNEKDTYTGVKGDFPPASHQTSGQRKTRIEDMKIPKHIKGFGGKKQHHSEKLGPKKVTSLKPGDTKIKKPTSRKQQLRRQYQDQSQADKIYEKERDEQTTTSYGQFKKLDEAFKLGETKRYSKYLKDRQAKRAKREADKKERESIDPKTKLPKGPKVKPKKKKPKEDKKEDLGVKEREITDPEEIEENVEEYQSEGDKKDDDDDEGLPSYWKDSGKSLWKSWLEKKNDECPNCGKKIWVPKKGIKRKLRNLIVMPDIYPSEIDGIESGEKSLWKAWLEKKIEGTKTDSSRYDETDRGFKTVEPKKTEQAITAQVKQTLSDRKERKEAQRKERFRKNPEAPPPYPATKPGETMSQYKQREEKRVDDLSYKRYNDTVNALRGIQERNAQIKVDAEKKRKKEEAEAAAKPSTPKGTSSSYKPRTKKPGSVTKKPGSVSKKPTSKPKTPKKIITDPEKIAENVEDNDTGEDKPEVVWKSWLEKKIDEKDCPYCKGNWSKNRKERWEMEDNMGNAGRLANLMQILHDKNPEHFHNVASKAPPEMQEAADKDEERRKKDPGDVSALKAEEGIGGMNMGSQRGLGHEAGYKQDPGQTAQITEVKDEESKKSGYQTDQQDESTDVEPNKQQIPPSKPGMDVAKVLYKKALITKYNNIYKPANI